MQTLTKEQEEWLSALESDKYKQTTKNLRDDTGYCCLGVACDLYDNTRWVFHDKNTCEFYYELIDHDSNIFKTFVTFLPDKVIKELGLYGCTGTIKEEYRKEFYTLIKAAGHDVSIKDVQTLAAYNDAGVSFKQIAYAIRKLPEAVFYTIV